MPTIEAKKSDLLKLIGKKLSNAELERALSYAKSEFSGEEEIKIEIADVNRPDLLSIEGIARQCKLGLGLISGLQKYKVKKTNLKIKAKSKTRPLIVAAIVKNLKFNNESIKQIVQLQEKLCGIFGRKRKEAALGIYDFDRIKWPIIYEDKEPEKIKFIPLEAKENLPKERFSGPQKLEISAETKEMTGKEILQKHPTGIAYKHLLENEKKYPLLYDSKGNVLSMPPIINSDYTGKITEKTKNVFIEVTGYNYRFIVPVLNTIVTSLADRGGKIEAVKINNLESPNLNPSMYSIDTEEVNSVLGLELDSKKIISLLKKYGYNAKGNKKLEIEIPAYRRDILDSRDIIEDIAIAYEYNKIKTTKPKVSSEGSESKEVELSRKISDLLVGLEFQEIATPNLTSKEILFGKMNKKPENMIEIDNPISELYCVLRPELLSSMLNFLSKNTTVGYPQKIFEIGNTIVQEKDKLKLCVASSHTQANFTELKQIFDYLARMFSLKYKLEEDACEEYIEGRCAKIIFETSKSKDFDSDQKSKKISDNKIIGYIGEISPKILSNFNLEFPVSVLELDLEEIFKELN